MTQSTKSWTWATLGVWAVVVWLAVAVAVHGADGEGKGEGAGEPVIGVDEQGNLHINTTRTNSTVYVNGIAIEERQDDALRNMVALLVSQQAALVSRTFYLCKIHGLFSPENVITTSADGANSVFAADMDGDGDLDVLSASSGDDMVAWYENLDGVGTFSEQKTITASANGARSVFAADLDGDGDMDVLSASNNDDKISWYKNLDGHGTFSRQKNLTTSADYAYSVYAADLDGDGDMDVLSASRNDDKIAWYENEDGLGSFSTQKVIATSANAPYSAYAADLDGDGDIDVLSASYSDDKIAWYENLFGNGTFSEEKVITTSATGAYAVFAADLDGDGDIDVLSASYSDNKVAWYENLFGNGTFSEQKIITTGATGAVSVFATDLDGDGDVDVLSASIFDNMVAWYENEDGKGTFSLQQNISTTAERASSVYAADLDGDGDIDVLSASENDDKVAWYENTC